MSFPTMWHVTQQRLRSACAYAQSDQSLFLSIEYSMIIKLLTEQNVAFLSLKGDCTGSAEYATLLETSCHGSYECRLLLYSFLN